MIPNVLLLQLLALAKIGHLAMDDPDAKQQAQDIIDEAKAYAEQ